MSESFDAVYAALQMVLRRKAIATEALTEQRDAILQCRYPNLEQSFHELNALRQQIARKILEGPGSEGLETHKRVIAEWNTKREQIESTLAKRIPEMDLKQELKAADPESITKALPSESVLIEFIRFVAYDFKSSPARDEPSWGPPRYTAFVLHADEPDSVHVIDLGEAEPVDRMIAAFRTSITGEAEPGGARGVKHPSIPPGQISVRSDQALLGSAIAAATRHLRVESRPYEPVERTELGAVLRRMVFDQLKSALNGCTQLFLAPDSNLTRLPFEVLPLEEERYLIDASCQFSYLGVGRDVLRFDADSTGQPTAPLVAADPDFDLAGGGAPEFTPGQPFRRLGGARQEGETVGGLLGVGPVLGDLVLEGELKACRSPSILHVATHGFFLPDAPPEPKDEKPEWATDAAIEDSRLTRLAGVQNPLLRCGLALAGANAWLQEGHLPPEAEDAILNGVDASALDLLATDLVVLSACDTGLGDVEVGEGVFGLRRAFILAGVKTLVMSLWKVPDQQTQELMVGFYGRILAGEPRAEALRLAQLVMKEKYPDPFYWGAFVCQGDPGPLVVLAEYSHPSSSTGI